MRHACIIRTLVYTDFRMGEEEEQEEVVEERGECGMVSAFLWKTMHGDVFCPCSDVAFPLTFKAFHHILLSFLLT